MIYFWLPTLGIAVLDKAISTLVQSNTVEREGPDLEAYLVLDVVIFPVDDGRRGVVEVDTSVLVEVEVGYLVVQTVEVERRHVRGRPQREQQRGRVDVRWRVSHGVVL